jgi:hypothetical protein
MKDQNSAHNIAPELPLQVDVEFCQIGKSGCIPMDVRRIVVRGQAKGANYAAVFSPWNKTDYAEFAYVGKFV